MDKREILKRYFGHGEFRPGQEALADALLSGRDVLGIMPTGSGKSVCYQLPALMLPGITLVISPLISLMKDQVAALIRAGVPAAYLNSSLTAAQQAEALRRAARGAYKIIYVAPERLESPGFIAFARGAEISLVAVDEAHCVSQWGQDFRPGYLRIADFVASLPRRPVLGAFTATATARVKADIERLIALRDPLRVSTGLDRPNLYFEVQRPKNKKTALIDFIRPRRDRSGIIYCSTRKNVEMVCDFLAERGASVTRYHAGLDDEERRRNQEDFIFDRARIMVATNAFGMGIDKSNVSYVLHYNMPQDIESYYQEAGRAGRDGEKAHCLLLWNAGDVQTAAYMIENSPENPELSEDERDLLRRREYERLERMTDYCRTRGCLRAFLLNYFGQQTEEYCGFCGSCTAETLTTDITEEARKILSAVKRVEGRCPSGLGLTLIARMLHGSREQRVIELGLDTLPCYGLLRSVTIERIREYIELLISEGYLFLSEGEYPTLRSTRRARDVLFNGETVSFTRRIQAAPERRPRLFSLETDTPPEDLLSALKSLRFELAKREKVPAYIIFTNAALADMALRQPRTMEEFIAVSGVGAVKAERYGGIFMAEIGKWLDITGGDGAPHK